MGRIPDPIHGTLNGLCKPSVAEGIASCARAQLIGSSGSDHQIVAVSAFETIPEHTLNVLKSIETQNQCAGGRPDQAAAPPAANTAAAAPAQRSA